MRKINVGIIGLGKMGLLHMGIFSNLQNCTIVAVAEKNKLILSVLKKYITKLNVYKDYHDLLKNEKLDIIVITTPVFLHKEMILTSMKHNVNIFVEKPLAMNFDQCKEIISQRNDKTTMVGFVRRFYATYNFAKNIIEKNDLGKILNVNSQMFVSEVMSKGSSWKFQKEQSGGGVLIDLGCHAIDLFHYIFGDIIEVHAFGQSIFTDVEDVVSINMNFLNGFFGHLNISWSKRGYRLPEFKINIQLEKGDIEVTEKYISIFSEKKTESLKKGNNIFYHQNLSKPVPINIGGSEFTLENQHFIDCIQNNKETIACFKESAKVNLVIDKIYSSIQNQRIEKINYKVM